MSYYKTSPALVPVKAAAPSLYEYRAGIKPKPVDVIEFEDCTTIVREVSGPEADKLLAEYERSLHK